MQEVLRNLFGRLLASLLLLLTPMLGTAQQSGIDNSLLTKDVLREECDLRTFAKADDCLKRLVPTLTYRAAHFAAYHATYLIKVNYEPGVAGSKATSKGTAFLVDERRGYFLTAKHVLLGSKIWSSLLTNHLFADLESALEDHLSRTALIEIQMSEDDAPVKARLIGMDRNSDLALVAIGNLNTLLIAQFPALFRPIQLSRETTCPENFTVISVGFRGTGDDNRLEKHSEPVFARADCRLQPNTYFIGGQQYRIALHKTDLKLYPGDSGGPILDSRFELVGVASGAREASNAPQSYFVPVSAVRAFLSRF